MESWKGSLAVMAVSSQVDLYRLGPCDQNERSCYKELVARVGKWADRSSGEPQENDHEADESGNNCLSLYLRRGEISMDRIVERIHTTR